MGLCNSTDLSKGRYLHTLPCASSSRRRLSDLPLGVLDLEFRALGLGFEALGLGFRALSGYDSVVLNENVREFFLVWVESTKKIAAFLNRRSIVLQYLSNSITIYPKSLL